MQITINTKEDSVEDIKKIIAVLNSLVEGHSTVAPMQMFGSNESGSQGIFNLFDNNEKKKENPEDVVRMIEY